MLPVASLRQQAASAIYALTYIILRPTLKWMAVFLIGAIGFSVLKLVDHEYQNRMELVVREESNLLLAFEEHVRRNLKGVDEILRELDEAYEASGRSSPQLLVHIQKTRSLPLVHVSMANEKGLIENSTLPELVSTDISYSEYFQYFKRVDDRSSYFARPVFVHETQKWIFHISRRLNKVDGRFGGIATVGVDPSYFGDFYQKMQLGKGFAISIVGLDGFVRVRQTLDKLVVGTDIRKAPFFSMLQTSKSGSYVIDSTFDNENRIYSYRAMEDYPFVLLIALLETDAFADFNRLRDRYWLIALIGIIFVISFFGLLIQMATLRDETEKSLRELNDQLTSNVSKRTEELETANRKLKIMAMMDALTGIANRRNFDDHYSRIWRTAMRQGRHLAIIMADIDWFKDYNDEYGHQTGDECLKQVAETLRAVTKRAADFVARYGGEEFIIILPDADAKIAAQIAEELRKQVEALKIVHDKSAFGFVTISVGVAVTIPKKGNDPLKLIETADIALYDAKNSGRNRVKRANDGNKVADGSENGRKGD